MRAIPFFAAVFFIGGNAASSQHSESMLMSEVIGVLYAGSVLQPEAFENEILPQLRTLDTESLQQCLARINGMGAADLANQAEIDKLMGSLGMGGSGSSSFGQMGLWAGEMSQALDSGRWQSSISAQTSAVFSLIQPMCQMMGAMAPEVGEICNNFPSLMYEGARITATVCD